MISAHGMHSVVLLKMMDKVVVSSPATIANFGPGFDSFGLCLDSPRDVISMKRLPQGRVEVKVVGKHDLPNDPARNTASYAAIKLAEICGCRRFGFSMTIRKGMKPGSGIGSSAASSTGGALAMASLLGLRNKDLVLEAAGMGEELIAGSRHFDNVAAALFGGFTVVSDFRSRRILRIRPPKFELAVVVPDISVETRRARELLPDKVPIGDAVSNLSWASGMVHAMMTKDVRAIGSYLDDRLALPYRRSLIPAYDAVRESAISAGASGFSIGGSGPAVFAVCEDGAERVMRAMQKTFRSEGGISSKSFVTVPGSGARIEE